MFKKSVFHISVTLVICLLLGGAFFSVCEAAPKKITISSLTAWPKTAFESEQFLKMLELAQKEADEK